MALFEDLRKQASDLGLGLTPESQEAVAGGMANLFAPTAVAGEAVGETIATVGDYMVPDAFGVGENIGKGIDYVMNNTTVGRLLGGYIKDVNDYTADKPELRRFAGNLMDTGNLAGMGALAQAPFKMAPQRLNAQALHEGDLIIDNFYNPKKPVNSDDYTKLDKWFEKQSEKLKATENPSKALTYTGTEAYQNAARWVNGMVGFLGKGSLRAAKSKMSPTSRAVFADYGIGEVGIKAAQDYVEAKSKYESLVAAGADKDAISAAKKDVANKLALGQQQLQATANISTQAGREASEMLKQVAVTASDSDVLTRTNGMPYFSPNRQSNWYNDIVEPTGNTADNKVIQDHIVSAQGLAPDERVKFIVKKATGKQTGKHWEDILQSDVKNPIAEAFAKYGKENQAYNLAGYTFESNTQLANYLKPLLEKEMKGKREKAQKSIPKNAPKIVEKVANRQIKTNYSLKYTDPKDIEKYGVWIQGSTMGSAKVEGGVNFLMKVNRDGSLQAVMSDKHDFLEKVSIVGNTIEKKLPTTVVAITKPMSYDVFNAVPSVFPKESQGLLKVQAGRRYESSKEGVYGGVKGQAEQTLEAVANLKNTVDPASVRREATDMALRTTGGVAAPTMFSSAMYGDDQ
jgi:hypothetical protein